ncbi:SURF1 family protein [Spongiibacter taiwanensis]
MLFLGLALISLVGFVLLGNWQLERRVWKLDLIERVEQRAHADAVSAPVRAEWSAVTRDAAEYRRVWVSGQFLQNANTQVVAATELGSGYWVLTPLQRPDGTLVLINRGYIGQGESPAPVPEGQVRLEGLLRISEPGGAYLRDNDPDADRWYSRDVAAIAEAKGYGQGRPLAPYFIDADAAQPGSPGSAAVSAEPAGGPVGGLTVITFHNSHLVYALTWYGMALLMVVAAGLIGRGLLRDWRGAVGRRKSEVGRLTRNPLGRVLLAWGSGTWKPGSMHCGYCRWILP